MKNKENKNVVQHLNQLKMDKKILGNFISYFPPIAYVAFTIVTHKKSDKIDWTEIVLAMIIGFVSVAIGNRIKNKGDVE